MSSLTVQPLASGSSCRTLPGEGNQVQPKAPLLQILRVAGAQEDVFTLKEVMHYLGQYIMGRQLYDKHRQHIVHCQDDPLGELLEVESFSVKNPSPVYEMLKKYLVVLGCADAAESLSVGRECVDGGVEDHGQVCGGVVKAGMEAGSNGPLLQTPSQRRPREPDDDSLEGLPRSACKRPKLDVSLDEWDLSGLPWWFLGNLRNNYSRRSNGSTDIHTNQLSPAQEEDTAIVSDTTDDLWFLTEGESEQVSVEMKEAALEEGSGGEGEPSLEEEDISGKEEKADREEEPDEDSQCLSDDTDTEISTQDAWQCTECRKYNIPHQRYCVRCWALRKNWYKDVPRLAHSLSVPDIPACSSLTAHDDDEEVSDTGIDVPDSSRTVSDPLILPSHSTADRPLPTMSVVMGKGKAPRLHALNDDEQLSGGESQENLGMEVEDVRPEALLEPCKLCRVRPRNGNIIHGRTAHLLTCFPCARRLHKFQAPCPGCGKIIQKVIKTFVV
ncbi:protein Mdm4 isoform X2 [Gouania willdenowi]|uniref:protein Mdm4 isoform X2 n=1 Tax=Gouania willdenowi TaxID=441366 RepID=UPI0010562C39|nr:protein Mdm4 isoform X2 [Gouania willdenowi]